MNQRLLIITDTWRNDVNGVSAFLKDAFVELEKVGFSCSVISPTEPILRSVPAIGFSEIRLVINPWRISELLNDQNPDYIHIATEGPLGWAARSWCEKNGFPYTTAYHTKWPEYIWTKIKFPRFISKQIVKNFHRLSYGIFVATDTLKHELESQGFERVVTISRGVDFDKFHPKWRTRARNDKTIRLLNVGRVSSEKNLEAFYDMEFFRELDSFDYNIQKVQVGNGPELRRYMKKYPYVEFLGEKRGKELWEEYANADVFVFPCKQDTFGIVQLEAMASGVPVAAFDGYSTSEIVTNGKNGWTSENLSVSVANCMKIPYHRVIDETFQRFSWSRSALIMKNTIQV